MVVTAGGGTVRLSRLFREGLQNCLSEGLERRSPGNPDKFPSALALAHRAVIPKYFRRGIGKNGQAG